LQVSGIFAIRSFSNRHSTQSLPRSQVECQPE
jgi:hypothetical protein